MKTNRDFGFRNSDFGLSGVRVFHPLAAIHIW